MKRGALRAVRLAMAGVAVMTVLGGLASAGAVLFSSSAGAAVTGSAYFPLSSPERIADTRANSGLALEGQTLGPDGTDIVPIPTGNAAGQVPTTATAVVLNVTAVNATQQSYFTVYPTNDPSAIQAGGQNANFSDLNFFPGTTQPNLVTTPVANPSGTQLEVSVFNHSGSADLVVDLEGYFAPPSGTTGEFFPLTPARITDTRTGSNQPNAGQTLGQSSTLQVQVTGAGGVPSSNVSAVELNVTATDTTAGSFFTAYPTGATRPNTSNLNWNPGVTVANRVIVPLGTGGTIDIYNYAGNADAVVDVDGYFTTSGYSATATQGSYFNAVTPARVSDTRTGSGEPEQGSPLGSQTSETVQIAGAATVPAVTSSTPPTAAVVNVTEATATAGSYLTVYPANVALPLASDVNFVAGDVIANSDMVALSPGGALGIYNWDGTTNVAVDVFGYYTPVQTDVVSVTPGTLTPGQNASQTITIGVTQNSNAVVGDPVTVTVSATSGTCASFPGGSNTATGTTDGGGQVLIAYTTASAAGTCKFTATESQTDQSNTGTITVS
ncbi:MAG TPA: hypothetical protein VL961_08015 [Acidimicrobiales bacterium]|nr:hypothetical protein [Acidimicrobiales bacterium]